MVCLENTPRPSYLDEELIAWKTVEWTAQRGVKIKRYRVIEEPISDYLEFEFDFKTINSQYVFVIDRKEYDVIVEKHSFDPNDCWYSIKNGVSNELFSEWNSSWMENLKQIINKVHQYQKYWRNCFKSCSVDKFLRR